MRYSFNKGIKKNHPFMKIFRKSLILATISTLLFMQLACLSLISSASSDLHAQAQSVPGAFESIGDEASDAFETSTDKSTNSSGNANSSTDSVSGSGSTKLDNWLNTVINLLSALVGIAVVGSIIFAGIQYITSGDNSSQVAAAKQRIAMSVLGLLLFFMGYALLQWLIPGGIW